MSLILSPVQEVGFTVQFNTPLPLNLLDIASLHSQFKSEYPIFQQVSPLPPIPVTPVIGLQPEIHFGGPPLPRVWFLSANGHHLIQFQADRLSYNWRRLAPSNVPADYPGFEVLLEKFLETLSAMEAWVAERGYIAPAYGPCELVYINLVPMEFDGHRRRISEVLSFFKPTGMAPVSNFRTSWLERFGGDEFEGWIWLEIVVGATMEGQSGVIVSLAGRSNIAQRDANILRLRLESTHSKVHEMLPSIFTAEVLETIA